MVIFCKSPFYNIEDWCRDQGYKEVPISNYNPSNKPLLIVDNRISVNCHEKTLHHELAIREYIQGLKDTKGAKVYFGSVRRAVSYIGDISLAIWVKR